MLYVNCEHYDNFHVAYKQNKEKRTRSVYIFFSSYESPYYGHDNRYQNEYDQTYAKKNSFPLSVYLISQHAFFFFLETLILYLLIFIHPSDFNSSQWEYDDLRKS